MGLIKMIFTGARRILPPPPAPPRRGDPSYSDDARRGAINAASLRSGPRWLPRRPDWLHTRRKNDG